MPFTNFAALTQEQKTIWSLDLWREARHYMFLSKFMGKGTNSMIQQCTELTQSEKGARAVITLVADLEEDGVAGDRELEGNEEGLSSYDQVIRIDQLRHANLHAGAMADQKSIINFRSESRDKLAYWLAERSDQMAFLTLAGINYTQKTDGSARNPNSNLPLLEYAADVTAPTAKRRLRWNSATKTLVPAATTNDVTAADSPSYEWITKLKAYAHTHGIRGIKEAGGKDAYHLFLTPDALVKLKTDPDYKANLQYAQARDSSNPLFSGSGVRVDGVYIHEYRHVPNTVGAASGSKFGAAGTVEGCHALFCGAQALGYADIGTANWTEKEFDYGNRPGISVGKIFGMKKPVFRSIWDNSVEDFGVIVNYMAQ